MSGQCSMKLDFSELYDLKKKLNRVGEDAAKKAVVKAAGKGRTVVRRAIRSEAPMGETGNLKRGIVSRGEKSKLKGRKVYKLMFDPDKDDIFQKPIKQPGKAGGSSEKGYYPASVEYGFLTRANEGGLKFISRKTGIGLKRVEGSHFMRDAAEGSRRTFERTIIETLEAELDKEWRK